ncbi:MAG TPA: SpoIIE family protein phosphatase [Deltaproteobacteria bacterium]|nr:SpoIIE family protein phosphatase [Deltaproteobacteria bacterium]
MKTRGIAFRLSFFILSVVALIFVSVFSYNYYFSRRILIKNAEQIARHFTLETVNRLETVLSSVVKVPLGLSSFLEYAQYYSETLNSICRSTMANNPEISGITIAFKPFGYAQEKLYHTFYYSKKDGEIELLEEGSRVSHYFTLDWYQISKELNRAVWSEPYYDAGGGNMLMATYSVPFYGTQSGASEFMGVVAADVSLTWLQDIVSAVKILETGYAFLITNTGTIVTHFDRDVIMNETIFSVAEAFGDTHLREVGKMMIRGESGFEYFKGPYAGKDWWISFAPLKSSGWSLCTVFPDDELMADVIRLNRTVLFIGISGLFGLFVIIVLIARSITRPLSALSKVTETIATGELDAQLPAIKTRDEVGRLSESIEHMKTSLKQYIVDLTRECAMRERIESELQIARQIQMGILKKTFPAFPDRSAFDIFAMIEPAREVGGDLYDFFFVDDHNLCMVIGDVAGKGIPAALMMAVTRTLIKARASTVLSPDEVLSIVNNELAEDNDSAMFVTLFMGVLDTHTGEMTYCNAGHNYPFLVSPNGEVTEIETRNGMPLGLVEDFPYETGKIMLPPGNIFYLYTDGVNEAMNAHDEQFSEDRIQSDLARLKNNSIRQITDGVMDSVKAFSQGMPQSDDITMLILKYYGNMEKTH